MGVGSVVVGIGPWASHVAVRAAQALWMGLDV